jgi:hypothetical protein
VCIKTDVDFGAHVIGLIVGIATETEVFGADRELDRTEQFGQTQLIRLMFSVLYTEVRYGTLPYSMGWYRTQVSMCMAYVDQN